MKYKKEFFKEKTKKKVKITILDSNYFWTSNRKKIKNKTFEIINKDEIYKKIKNKKSLNLKGKYIEDFSLSEYKKKHGIEVDSLITITDLFAVDAFFDVEENDTIDFSKCIFDGNKALFHYTAFGNAKVSFEESIINPVTSGFAYTVFGEGDICFNKVHFKNGSGKFSYANFGKGNVDLREAIFEKFKIPESNKNAKPKGKSSRKKKKGKKKEKLLFFELNSGCADFNKAILSEGSINFSKASFSDGDLIFSDFNVKKGEINFNKITCGTGEKYFSRAILGNNKVDFSFAKFGDGSIRFDDAKFGNGDINFRGIRFGKGYKAFHGAKFGNGQKIFKDAHFGNGDVLFSGSEFGNGEVDFSGATFGKGNIIFGNYQSCDGGKEEFRFTTFGKGKVNFVNTDFGEGTVGFSEVDFGEGEIDFRYAKFKGNEIWFTRSVFGKEKVNFNGIKFKSSKVSFRQTRIPEITFNWAEISGCWDMRVEEAKVIDFSETKIYGDIDLGFYGREIYDYTNKKTYLEKNTCPRVDQIKLINTKLYGRIYIDYNAFKLGNAIRNQGDTTNHRQKRDQLRLLKENFRKLGQYEDEDKAYVQFMYHKIRAEEFEITGGLHSYFADFFPKRLFTKDWKKGSMFSKLTWNIKKLGGILIGSLLWILDSFVFFFKWLVYETMGLYGTSPFRVFLSMIVVIFGFSWMYSQLPPPLVGCPFPLFHSVITFLTIGYGIDYANLSSFAGKMFSGVEGFMGLFLMSYFTIAFVRKVLR